MAPQMTTRTPWAMRASGGARDDHAFLQRADVEQPHIGREPRNAADGERQRRVGSRRELAQALFGDGVLLPSRHATHEITGSEAVELRVHHLAHGHGAHHLADVDRTNVVVLVGDPAAHGGLECDDLRLQQRLPFAGLLDGLLDELEVALGHHAHRALGEHPLSIDLAHVVPPPLTSAYGVITPHCVPRATDGSPLVVGAEASRRSPSVKCSCTLPHGSFQ